MKYATAFVLLLFVGLCTIVVIVRIGQLGEKIDHLSNQIDELTELVQANSAMEQFLPGAKQTIFLDDPENLIANGRVFLDPQSAVHNRGESGYRYRIDNVPPMIRSSESSEWIIIPALRGQTIHVFSVAGNDGEKYVGYYICVTDSSSCTETTTTGILAKR